MKIKRSICSIFLMICILLTACNLPAPASTPGVGPSTPFYTNYILDCSIKNADQMNPIQPPPGCDRWPDNRYERPFNADKQDKYYPDMDLLFSALGKTNGWYFVRIALDGLRPGSQTLLGTYGIEIDTDRDFRGDFLVSGTPQAGSSPNWSPAGIQIWHDTNNDVGNQKPAQPDAPYSGNGYDALVFGNANDANLNAAFMRIQEIEKHEYVEIAFRPSLIDNAGSFYWWAWSDEGVRQLGSFDYHDKFPLPTAGEPYQGSQYFPDRAIADLDNTCMDYYANEAPTGDTHFCRGDPSVSYIPPGDGCDDPLIEMDEILCPSPTATPETATVTVTETPWMDSPTPCDPGDTSCPSPTPTPTCERGGLGLPVRGIDATPNPCAPTQTLPPCPRLRFLGNTPTPDPNCQTETPTLPCPNTSAAAPLCTPTPTPTLCPNGSAAAANVGCTPTPSPTLCPPTGLTGAAANGPGCTPTPSPTLCLNAAGAPAGCTPTPSVTPCPPTGLTGAAANGPGCTPTPSPTLCLNAAGAPVGCTPTPSGTPCPPPNAAGLAANGGCTPTPTHRITFTFKPPTRTPKPTKNPTKVPTKCTPVGASTNGNCQ